MDQQQPGGSYQLPHFAQPLKAADPRAVGPYEILGRLGGGGMGMVYLARPRMPAETDRVPAGQLVAIKVIRESLALDEGFRTRFGSEVANAQRVASFCTAQVYDYGAGEQPYLVTEYIEGPTLNRQVSQHGALSPGALHGVAVGVAAALTAIHAAGVVHRDLKPSNVVLSMSGPRVIDFGIARALDAVSGLTATGELIGSPGWIAPEQLQGDAVTPAADIFSWGCLVAFAGRAAHPYGRGNAFEMASRILHGTPDLDGLPAQLRVLIAAAISQHPGLRPSAQDLLLSLVGGSAQGITANTTQVLANTWEAPREVFNEAGRGLDAAPPTAPDQEAAPDQGVALDQGAAPDQDLAPTSRDEPAVTRHDAVPDGAKALSEDPLEPPPRHDLPTVSGHPGGRLADRPGHPAPDDAAVAREGTERMAPPAFPEEKHSGPGRRRWFLAAAGALAIVLATAAVLLSLRDESPGKGGSRGTLTNSGFKPVQLSRERPSEVGRALTDTSAEFTVGRPGCGAASYRGLRANGQFCLVRVAIRNVADPVEPSRVRIQRDRQVLIDSASARHTPVKVAGGFLAADSELPPGALIAGELLYDIPKGTVPARLELFQAPGSKGADVWL